MPRVQFLSASVVVLGQTFTPSLLTPDLFSRFFSQERPRGIATNVIAQLEYAESGYLVMLEESKLQVLKKGPTPAQLNRVGEIATYFLEQNPLVRLTAVGLNFEAFVRYSGRGSRRKSSEGGEVRFLRTFSAVDVLNELVGSEIHSGQIHVVYPQDGARCRLALRSDAKLNNNRGVALDLNANQDIRDRSEVEPHIAALRHWHRHLFDIGERLARLV